jgi:hypothetical protein
MSDQVVFIIKKTALSEDEMADFINLKFDKIFSRVYYKEPNVCIYINILENFTTDNIVVELFYNYLAQFDKDDYVFSRIGESFDDYEFLGDCYCNFRKYLDFYDLEVVRKFDFVDRSVQRRNNAISHVISFIENLDPEENKNYLDHIYEGNYEDYSDEHPNYKYDSDNIIEFKFSGRNYMIFKNLDK